MFKIHNWITFTLVPIGLLALLFLFTRKTGELSNQVDTYGKKYNYKGELLFSLSHGKGIAHYENGEIYKGSFCLGGKNGSGIYIFQNQDKYRGEFKYGKRTGFGKYISVDGSYYEGHYKNDKKHGEGTQYIAYKNTIYKGNFKNGLKEGEGRLSINKDSFVYEGNFNSDTAIGFCTIYTAEYTFKGENTNFKRNGYGKIIFKQGNMYEGIFFNDEIHGLGMYAYENGDKFTGIFQHGSPHKGTMYFSNGKTFSGTIIDKKHLYGILTTTKKETISNCPNCTKYIGTFKYNPKINGFEKSGTGACYNADDSLVYIGQFSLNKPQEEYPSSKKDSYLIRFLEILLDTALLLTNE